jgi:hypothetical protein
MRSPFGCLQSQNQLPQSSVVLHVTLVAPVGLESPGGGVAPGGVAPGGVAPGGVWPEPDDPDEPPEEPELPPELELVDPSDEHATSAKETRAMGSSERKMDMLKDLRSDGAPFATCVPAEITRDRGCVTHAE